MLAKYVPGGIKYKIHIHKVLSTYFHK